MLFGLSPALFRLDETLSTLRFAMRAKQIQTTATGARMRVGIGVLGHWDWSCGVVGLPALMHWGIGALGHRGIGALGHWYIKTMAILWLYGDQTWPNYGSQP